MADDGWDYPIPRREVSRNTSSTARAWFDNLRSPRSPPAHRGVRIAEGLYLTTPTVALVREEPVVARGTWLGRFLRAGALRSASARVWRRASCLYAT